MDEFLDDKKDQLFGDKKMSTKAMIKRSFKYLKPELGNFILALLLLFVNVAIELLIPRVVGKVTTSLSNLASDSSITLIYILGFVIGYLVIALIAQVILYIQSMIMQKAGQRIIYSLRMEVFEHIESMSLNQFNIMPVGSLVTRVASYTSTMSDLFTSVLISLLKNAIMVIGVYVAMIIISPKLATFMLAFVVVVFILSFIFEKVVTKLFRKERKYQSDLNTFLSENISGIKITQIFNQQNRKRLEFKERNKNCLNIRYQLIGTFGLYRPIINFLYYLSIAFFFYFSIETISDGGLVIAFYIYLSRFFNPIETLADNLNSLQRALSSCERLYNLLDVPPDVLDAPTAKKIEHFNGKIEFKNVWFAYEKEDWILKDVSFVVEPKTTCAFVGATGAGKTTILSLIVRNFEIQKGDIFIDDINIKDIEIESLRKAIGQMLQDVFLFSGSIKSNITLHDETFADEEIEHACDYVNASSFINKLPNRYETEVTERGENFSSGQRQLLSFARTVLHKPQILILDEATANIDTETEVLIQESLQKMKSIGTMLVVAHRLSTIQHCDNIVVLNRGEIIEQGNHQQLLKQKGHYYKLYQLQFENKE